MGITATAGAKSLSHTVSFGIILAFLTNIAQFTYWKCKPRRGTHWQKNGPLYLTLAAVPLVMADLTRHVLQDAGMWVGPSSSMYDEECCSLHSCRGMHGPAASPGPASCSPLGAPTPASSASWPGSFGQRTFQRKCARSCAHVSKGFWLSQGQLFSGCAQAKDGPRE